MALSFASLTSFSKMQSGVWYSGSITPRVTVRCCETAKEPPPKSKLQVGSPIIIVEAPKVIKTAASMPCLRANAGLVKPGDVGRSFFFFQNPFSNLRTNLRLNHVFLVIKTYRVYVLVYFFFYGFNHCFYFYFCRIVSRKPKDLWAVRLSIGTYLLDGKYFKALELEE